MDELKEKILHGTIKSLEIIGIKNLVDMIEKSHKEQREYGLAICSNNDIPPFGDIFLSKMTIGTENNVKFEDCKHTQIGSFHTHIGTNNELSIGDIYAELQAKNNFSCMGITDNKNENKKTISCSINAYHVDPLIALDFYKKQDKFLRKLKEYDIPVNYPRVNSDQRQMRTVLNAGACISEYNEGRLSALADCRYLRVN